MRGGEHILDRSRCQRCWECARQCCSRGLECVGRDVTVGEVLEVVLRDRPFYETSGGTAGFTKPAPRGGMTLSGGEPTQQADFSVALL